MAPKPTVYIALACVLYTLLTIPTLAMRSASYIPKTIPISIITSSRPDTPHLLDHYTPCDPSAKSWKVYNSAKRSYPDLAIHATASASSTMLRKKIEDFPGTVILAGTATKPKFIGITTSKDAKKIQQTLQISVTHMFCKK